MTAVKGGDVEVYKDTPSSGTVKTLCLVIILSFKIGHLEIVSRIGSVPSLLRERLYCVCHEVGVTWCVK